MTTHPDHQHRRAGHQRPRDADGGQTSLGARSARRRAGRRGRHGRLGRPGRRGTRRRRASSTPAAGRCCPASWTATATWSSPATGRRSSRPGWPATPYAAGGIRTTVAATRAATDEQLTATSPGWSQEMRRQGTTTVEIKCGYGLTRPRRGAQPGGRAAVHRRDDVPRRARRARRSSRTTRRRTSTSSPARCSRPRRRTRAGSTCSASRARSTSTRRARCSPPARRTASSGRLHANQLGPGPGVRLAAELGLAAVDHCTYLADADVDALRDSGTDRDAAARASSSPPGSPTPTRAGCSTPASGSRWPATATRLLLHQLGPALHRAGGPRDGDDPGRGACTPRRTAARRPCVRDDVGALTVGARADLVLLDAPSHVHLAYRPGVPLVAGTWVGGRPAWP